jgi:hypothetical protein
MHFLRGLFLLPAQQYFLTNVNLVLFGKIS